MILLQQLQAIMPNSGKNAAIYLQPLNDALTEFGIATASRLQMLLANIAVESGELHTVEENLNYSANALVRIFPTHFPNLDSTTSYSCNPEKIANKVYANRNGNGNEASGDGWKYRGAGLIQLTFKDNQAACASYFKISTDKIADWLKTPVGATRSAVWFWTVRSCNQYADKGEFSAVCDLINIGHVTQKEGTANGYASRLNFYNAAKKVLA